MINYCNEFDLYCRQRIRQRNETFKLEILNSVVTSWKEQSTDSAGNVISIYHIGDQWWDLCKGPHVSFTGKVC